MRAPRLLHAEDGALAFWVSQWQSRKRVGAFWRIAPSSVEASSTLTREISALQEAMSRFGAHEAFVVTADEERTVDLPEGTVHIVPAWKWFLRH